MKFPTIGHNLQVAVLTCLIATSYVQNVNAHTSSELIAAERVSRIINNTTPANTLTTERLLRQKRILAPFVAQNTGRANLHRQAATKLNSINFILNKRKAAPLAPLRSVRITQAAPLNVLSDRRPSASLQLPQLKQRIRNLTKVVAATGSKPTLRRRAKAMHAADIQNLKRRSRISASQRKPVGNETDVSTLLNDRRPADQLSVPKLRARVNALRHTLRHHNTSRDTRLRLVKKLRVDRAELRHRINIHRLARAGDKTQRLSRKFPHARNAANVKRLLTDHRTARSLKKYQLTRRIKATRTVLQFVPMSNIQRTRLQVLIKSDRLEKRHRLLNARDKRLAMITRQRSRGQLRIGVNPNNSPFPKNWDGRQGDIAAAEADDDMIQRQFLVPDRRKFKRRYSRAEIVRRPDLTRKFAGIDVDTVNFGFNEYWIREEEVDELERMAVTIERILAVRPQEVFQIEGHTDAVGSDVYNLSLSRQRAEAVKDALTKFFVISPHALVTVGLGERYLKIPTPDAESENRRVSVRRITSIVHR